MDLQKILFDRYNNETLASVYILNYDSQSMNAENWTNSFIQLFTKMEDHPDVLKVKRGEKENEYKVDSTDIVAFLKFINYRPLKLKKKFIFIYEAHLLSTILSNKLLKVIEELSDQFCLFLMVPDKASMLATIESRGIKIHLASSKNNQSSESKIDLTQFKTPSELLAFVKKQGDNNGFNHDKVFIEQTIEKFLQNLKASDHAYKALEDQLACLKEFEVSADFNNARLPRISSFFS